MKNWQNKQYLNFKNFCQISLYPHFTQIRNKANQKLNWLNLHITHTHKKKKFFFIENLSKLAFA